MRSLKREVEVLCSREGSPVAFDYFHRRFFSREDAKIHQADLHKHILISKVDYLTFQYKGFYALNVINKVDTGSLIPFLTEYLRTRLQMQISGKQKHT